MSMSCLSYIQIYMHGVFTCRIATIDRTIKNNGVCYMGVLIDYVQFLYQK